MFEATLLLRFISFPLILIKIEPSNSSLSFIKISLPRLIPILVIYDNRFFTSSLTRITFAVSFSFNSVIATTNFDFFIFPFLSGIG